MDYCPVRRAQLTPEAVEQQSGSAAVITTSNARARARTTGERTRPVQTCLFDCSGQDRDADAEGLLPFRLQRVRQKWKQMLKVRCLLTSAGKTEMEADANDLLPWMQGQTHLLRHACGTALPSVTALMAAEHKLLGGGGLRSTTLLRPPRMQQRMVSGSTIASQSQFPTLKGCRRLMHFTDSPALSLSN